MSDRFVSGFRGPTPPKVDPDQPGAGRRPATERSRPAWAEVDLDAVTRNARALADLVAPATLCAVVKADAYGHGAEGVARAARAGGAGGLAVALVDEGVELRQTGVEGPILLLSEPPAEGNKAMVAAGLVPTLYTEPGIKAAAAAARLLGVRMGVHLKVDTGMHRVGAPAADLTTLARAVAAEDSLRLEGVWTHLAVADGDSADDIAFTEAQLDAFEAAAAGLEGPLVRHAANTAGALSYPRARYDLVRVGLGLYGLHPSPAVARAWAGAGAEPLRPALSLKAAVTAVRRLPAGARPSYGRRRPLPVDSVVATVPLGYADGLPRRLLDGGFEVLIGGRRRPLAGTVTMDQIVVDCGPEGDVAVGDEVVLLGAQGREEVTAGEWADRLGTISYEVLTGIGPRVPRRARGGPGPVTPPRAGPPLP